VERLESDARLSNTPIHVACTNGRVVLRGTVGSAADRSRAARDGAVPGVAAVNVDRLSVQPSTPEEILAQAAATVSDADIRRAIESRLASDPRIPPLASNVSVDDAAVTLTGVVDNLPAKRAAFDQAAGVAGVRLVQNKLIVRPQKRADDTTIARLVQQAFSIDPVAERGAPAVRVDQGNIRLTGEASSAFERQHLDDVAARATGAISVDNDVRVAPRKQALGS
jgi:osmotically-inducible protein OsmY